MEPREHPRVSGSDQSSSGFSEVPRTVFFDTNFFRALLKDDFQSNLENKKSDLRVALQLPFRPWRTPFSFMEWIGMKSKSLPKPTPFDPASVTGTDFIIPAYRHYEEHYASVRELDRENLEAPALSFLGKEPS